MRILISLVLLGAWCSLGAVVTIKGNDNIKNFTLEVLEGQRFEVVNAYLGDATSLRLISGIPLVVQYNNLRSYQTEITQHFGPCSISVPSGINSQYVMLMYQVVDLNEDATDSVGSSSYKATLSASGDRLAIAQQNGTNSVTRVYEYDGSNWIQLGEDVQ